MRVSTIVEGILRDYPLARSSDKELLLKVWESYGFYLDERQRQIFKQLPSMETLTRVRRKIQESGKFPAMASVSRQRKFKAMVVQQQMPKTPVEKVEPLLEQTTFI